MIFICKKYTVAGHLGLVIVIYACASRSYKKGEKKGKELFLTLKNVRFSKSSKSYINITEAKGHSNS